jgi:hypothetical protein
MKKFVTTCLILSLVGLILYSLFVPGGTVLLVISLLSLSTFYFYFGIVYFNNIPLKLIFKKEAYTEISTNRIVGSIILGISISTLIMGILFKILLWKGYSVMFYTGTVLFFKVLIAFIIVYFTNKSVYSKKILLKMRFLAIINVLLFIIPDLFFFEIRYRDYPNYVSAYKNAKLNSKSPYLWKIEEEEYQKIIKKNNEQK